MSKNLLVEVSIPDEHKELAQMLADGLAVKEIAQKKKISKRVLDGRLYRMRLKYGCSNTMSLLIFFVRNGVIK